MDIGRNDPCPCGSGKKFKKCHMGREEELVIEKLAHMPDDSAEKICELPEVEYGRCREIMDGLDLEKVAKTKIGIRFIDLGSYLELEIIDREKPKNLDQISAGQMINPLKTRNADSKNIYIAISPAVSDSTLIHQIAHALDYLAGSGNNPGMARALSMELNIPLELLEHPKEFGEWLHFLQNEFNIKLDAEDEIVSYLHDTAHLIPGKILAGEDYTIISASAQRILEFISQNRESIDERIKSREGYIKQESPSANNQ